MKKLFLLLSVLFSISSFSQIITVETNKYTVPQLVNTVLINSPCVSATNISWKTGTNFSSSNGIGFFENTNPDFPINSGVILSTGNVLNSVGPNTSQLNDGSDNWPGDGNLEGTLSQAGISMNSKNATVLEFDFTPISSNFSFDFLFASEEYGNFQCQFSDAFAFLLTNTETGITTNLAVVPNTNLPISVVTIRDELYNSSCSSENSKYFGSYNGGSAANTSATNFNGQTVLMNASATLEVNTTYHIKLVIADRSDSDSDSAIFIASDSFNIGQNVLGQDLSIINNNALCSNETYVLDSELNPNDYTFSWTKDGVTIPNENGPKITISESGVYVITYQKKQSGCTPITDEIIVEYLPIIKTESPVNLYKCNTGANSYKYDLSINTNILKKGLDPSTKITYHISLADANNNIKPLPLLFNGKGTEIIYARIKVPNSSCFIVKKFNLLLTSPPIINKPNDLVSCSNKNTSLFNLTTQDTTILNGQSSVIFTVLYYTSLADATAEQNKITNPNNFTSGNNIIYFRLQNATDSNCYTIDSFSLIIKPVPIVDKFPDIVTCESYTLPKLANGNYFSEQNGSGTPLFEGDVFTKTQNIYIFNQPDGPSGCSAESSFNIKIINPLELSPQGGDFCGSFTLPDLLGGNYYTESGGNGTIIEPGSEIFTSQTVYVYFKSSVPPFCVIDTDFILNILPEITLEKFNNVFDCKQYTLPALTNGNYFTESDGNGIPMFESDLIVATQKIYVFVKNSNGCTSEESFMVIIGIEKPDDITQCEPYVLPILPIGNYFTGPKGTGNKIDNETEISLSQRIYIYVSETTNIPNCTDNIYFDIKINQPPIDKLDDVSVCESYTLPNISNGEYFTESDGKGLKLNAGDIIFNSQPIYIYKKDFVTNCINQSIFNVDVTPKPLISSRADIDVCNFYVLTNLENGNYYTGPNGTGNLLQAGTKLTESQLIYIYAISNNDLKCSAENSFNITIFLVEADAPTDVVTCVSYTLPPLTTGNYYSQSGGTNNPQAILLNAGDVISTSTTLYVYTESGERINCTDENSFTITIVENPIVNIVPNNLSTVCDEDDSNDGVTSFDLSQLESVILGSQISDEFKVEFFSSPTDAVTGVNPITSTNLKTVFVKLSNTLTTTNCYDLRSLNIVVNKLPDPKPKDGIICFNSTTNTLLNPYTIQSGLNDATHTFEWINDSGEIVGTKSSYQAILPGVYTLVATNNSTGCSSVQIPVTVAPSEPAVITYTITEDFTRNQNITVIATGTGGNYEYKLDNGKFQDYPIFENVDSGIHQITVNDKNGCGTAITNALVINYPRFFTPNFDGYNDTWNIFDLKDQENAKIYIFNRLGKFIIEIQPNGKGWDGTYNGEKLPSTDYWFVVNYEKNGISKTFKSHFTLKR